MTAWFTRPFGLACGFAAAALLVLAGLGWATFTALEAEAGQLEATARADRAGRERLALWRLDGFVLPFVGRENARPFGEFAAPSPLAAEPLPPWVLLHAQLDPAGDWTSPQGDRADHLARLRERLPPAEAARLLALPPPTVTLPMLAAEAEALGKRGVTAAAKPTIAPGGFGQGVGGGIQGGIGGGMGGIGGGIGGIGGGIGGAGGIQGGGIGGGGIQGGFFGQPAPKAAAGGEGGRGGGYAPGGPPALTPQPLPAQQAIGPPPPAALNELKQVPPADYALRQQAALNNIRLGDRPAGPLPVPDGVLANLPDTAKDKLAKAEDASGAGDRKKRDLGRVLAALPGVHLGPVRAVWVSAAGGDELLLVRTADAGGRRLYQAVWLDWPQLQQVLGGLVADLFPAAEVRPVRTPTVAPERAMTTLPAELAPPPAVAPAAGWTPLRTGLALAWGATLLALGAVAAGGRSLAALADRRVRFVSAVTHELRTPLTSLRLYLDLLAGGLVTDPAKQHEYLVTLTGEADRLHRLIENVLDFARLEKRSVRATLAPTPAADLLAELSAVWADRLAADGKELVVTSTLPPDLLLATDPRMAGQVLANLVDNARKYSRGAADPRVWVWARPGPRGRVAFEVEDRGPGVPPADRAGLFRAFRRGRDVDAVAGGAGLGLALAAQWAGLLGGRLAYRPADGGVGACFRLELPAGLPGGGPAGTTPGCRPDPTPPTEPPAGTARPGPG